MMSCSFGRWAGRDGDRDPPRSLLTTDNLMVRRPQLLFEVVPGHVGSPQSEVPHMSHGVGADYAELGPGEVRLQQASDNTLDLVSSGTACAPFLEAVDNNLAAN